MRPRVPLPLVLVWLLATVLPAAAMRRCGDVDGTRVACACGDLIVSAVTLAATDPVTAGACAGNALLVSAPGAVRLDLGGQTLRGQGVGVGVLVLRGSLTLVGPGAVEGFETGILARGAHALASATGVRVAGNRLDGLLVDGEAYVVQGCVAEGNGRDGFALGGGAWALDGSRASDNGRHGFRLSGMGGHIGGGLGNEARANGDAGFWLQGGMHEVLGAIATGNRGNGLFGTVVHTLLAGVRSDANLGNGIWVTGAGLAIADSTATDNRGFGLWASGSDVDDQGGNRGAGNAGLLRPSAAPPLMMRETPTMAQCRIGMMGACR